MPIEGAEVVVEQPTGDTSSTTDVASGGKTPDTAVAGKGVPASSAVKPDEIERRIAGLTADLQKERKARQKYEQDLRTERASLETERKRVLALSGVTPQSTDDQETEAIRKAFAQRFPELASLTKEDIAALRELRSSASNLQETTNHYWAQHGATMVKSVEAEIEKELGGKLSDRQRERIGRAYAAEAEANEDFLNRHAQGDKTLVAEFAKQWVDDWFEPARRKVTQQAVERQRVVPSGKDRGIVTHGEKKIDVTDPKAVEDFLVKSYREKNGEFGRR